MDPSTRLQNLLRRDRIIVLGGVTGLALLAAFYTASIGPVSSHGMVAPETLAPPQLHSWHTGDLSLLFLMWTLMMVAMMAPAVAPYVMTHAKISRQQHADESPYRATAAFFMGYVVLWIGFSLVATFAQWALFRAGLISSMGVSTNALLSGVLVMTAGIYQWTPLKHACLSRCRSPLGFFMTEWRRGTGGALIMGLKHGVVCVGCCWALMALLFVAGVMNFLWMVMLAAFVLLEKAVPQGHLVGYLAGLGLVGWGLYLLQTGLQS